MMMRFVGVALLFVLTVVVVQAEYNYKIFNSGITPVSDQDCEADCSPKVNDAFKNFRKVARNLLRVFVVNETSFCNGGCEIRGIPEFTQNISCKMDKEGKIHDHTFVLNFTNLRADCSCDLNSARSATAEMINKGSVLVAKCGANKDVKDVLPYNPITCTDEPSSATPKNIKVKLLFKLENTRIDYVLRADPASDHVAPLSIAMLINNEKTWDYEGADFKDAFDNCVHKNMELVFRKVVNHIYPTVFTCLGPKGSMPGVAELLKQVTNCNKNSV